MSPVQSTWRTFASHTARDVEREETRRLTGRYAPDAAPEGLRERISTLSAAILWISVSTVPKIPVDGRCEDVIFFLVRVDPNWGLLGDP